MLIDDPVYASENPHVQAGLSPTNLAWSFTTFRDGNWIPFTWLSLMLDTTVFGVRPGGYHVTNVLLHVVNTLLLFAFLARATGNQLRSACVAALFALHPLHVESVAWITERKDVLSTLFGLGSLLAYVTYARNGKVWVFAACFLCFLASLLAKQTLVTLPFVFLLLDFWPLGRFIPGSSRVRLVAEKVPFFAASVAFSAIALVAQRGGHTVASLSRFPVATRCLNAILAYGAYLDKTLFPYHLAVFYPHPGEYFSPAAVAAAAAVLVGASAAAVAGARRYPYLFVGWAWYLGTLVPMIGLVQVGRQQMADRYTYFPLIGVFLTAVWLCGEVMAALPAGRGVQPLSAGLSSFRTRALAAAAGVVLVLFGSLAFVQAGYWRDSISLFRHAHECDEDNSVAASALGSTLVAEGQTDEGIALLESAVRLAPNDAESHFTLAVGLEKAGRVDQARRQYEAALALDDWDPRAHTNLARILWKDREIAAAKQHFLRAIQIDPDHVSAYVNLAALCGETGDFASSIAYNERALALDPTLLLCHYNVAMALRAQGRFEQAADRLRRLLDLSPDDADAHRELVRTLAMQQRSATGS